MSNYFYGNILENTNSLSLVNFYKLPTILNTLNHSYKQNDSYFTFFYSIFDSFFTVFGNLLKSFKNINHLNSFFGLLVDFYNSIIDYYMTIVSSNMLFADVMSNYSNNALSKAHT